MNVEKLKQLEQQVRIGGKGTARRKKKVVHKSGALDDKKLQTSIKKLGLSVIPGIEEISMIKDDGEVLHFNNPKLSASLASNTFAITGHAEIKQITDMLPSLLGQLKGDTYSAFQKIMAGSKSEEKATELQPPQPHNDDDDDVPELVGNFDAPSLIEVA